MLARRFVPRGVRIILAGLLLNVLVFRDLPILAGGVLQTIGFAIIAMVPAIWLLRYPGARWVLLAVAVAGYAAFAWSFPWLESFVDRHFRVGLVLFYDFPPWPWLSLVLIGLVMGTDWLAAQRRSEAEGARFLALVAIAGALMLVAFVTWDWWVQTPTRLGMKRDFILNNHWTPRGPSLLWVLGTLWLTLGAAYWVMQRRHWQLPWLVDLRPDGALPLLRPPDPGLHARGRVAGLALQRLAALLSRQRRAPAGAARRSAGRGSGSSVSCASLSLPVMLRRTRARARP